MYKIYNEYIKYAILRLKGFSSSNYSLFKSHVECYVTHKGKGIEHPRAGHGGSEGQYRYSSILSLTILHKGPTKCIFGSIVY